MADIGVPQYVREERLPSEGTAEAVAAGALAAAQVASGAIAQSKTNKLRDALAETARDALEAEQAPGAVDQAQQAADDGYGPPAFGFNQREQDLYNQLKTYQDQLSQTSGAVKAAVLNKAKRLTTEAMRKNPSLRDALRNEFQEFVGLNPDFDALGVFDGSNTSANAMSNKQRDLIFKRAYDRPSEGGMGIPTTIPFGSPEFVRAFLAKEDTDTLRNNRIFLLNAASTGAEFNLQQNAAAIQDALSTNLNGVDGYFQTTKAQVLEMNFMANKIATGQASPEEVAEYDLWKQAGQAEILNGFEQYKNQLELMKIKMPAGERETELGVKTIQQIDDAIQYVTRWQSAIETMGSNPGVVDLMDIESELRTLTWRRNYPQQDRMADSIRRIEPIIKVAEVIGLKDVMLRDTMGNLAIDGIKGYIVDTLSMGQQPMDAIEGPLNSDAVRNAAIRSATTSGGNPYGNGTDAEQGLVAIEKMATAVAHEAAVNEVYNQAGIPEQSTIYGSMVAQIPHFNELRTGRQYHPSTVAQVAELYGRTETPEQVSAIRKSGRVPAEAAGIVALGDEMTAYLTDPASPGVNGKLSEFSRRLNRRQYGNKGLLEFIDVDYDSLSEGSIKLTLQEGAAKAILSSSPSAAISRAGVSETQARMKQQELQKELAQLQKEINEMLRFVAHADFYRNPDAKTPLYALTFEQYGFNNLFGPQ